MARKSARKSNGAGKPGWLAMLGKWLGTLLVWGLIVGLFVAGWFYSGLPDVENSLAPSRRPTIWILDANGKELAAVGDLYGIPVKLADLPKALPNAVMATEDRRFYNHFGIDVIGLARAMLANIRARRIVQGGSTITQQVAKNLFLSPERTIKRKIQEVMLALWLENRFSKDQILELYLNRVYLGAGTYGVDAAAQKYFGQSASALTVWQSAMVAGLLKAPSRYNPHANKNRAETRTRQVLANMVAAGYLSDDQAKAAEAPKGRGRVAKAGRRAPYFVDWILDQVRDYVGGRDTDLIIKTTLDLNLQSAAERSLAAALAASGAKRDVDEGAVIVMTPEGDVRAMVGGADYGDSQYNRVTLAQRQPGSAFKPIVYLAGLEAGVRPSDIFEDAPVRVGDWSPKNFDNKYIGSVTVADALARSINTVAVRVALKAGIGRVAETARRLGLDPGAKPDASIALGTQETTLADLTAAYAVLANGGTGVIAHGIKEIRDPAGNLLYARQGSGLGRVVDVDRIGPMNRMLQGVIETGTGRGANIGRAAAGKTGTSQNFRDALFVGYTADYVCGVWFGNDDGSPMKSVSGGSMPTRVWKEVMLAAHKGLPARPLAQPKDSRRFFERLFSTIERAKQQTPKSGADAAPESLGRPVQAPPAFEGN